ncbi:MAG TPA: DUF2252 family protein, partial [Anaerolineales bacterium]|nr:DUF2252 family protein [Anaerolineales bacterium]
NDKLDPVPPSREKEILAALPGYLLSLSGAGKTPAFDHLHVKDFAIRLNAGTGSLGTPRYYLLIEGKTDHPQDDVILDLKRQTKPSAYPFLSPEQQLVYDHEFKDDAQRAAFAYRAMTHSADKYLGWLPLPDGNYLVRERTFVKEAFPLALLIDADDYRKMAEQWGEILATLHARADHLPGRQESEGFARQVVDQVGKKRSVFGNLVREVALQYAAQVRKDWEVFRQTIR